MPELLQTGSRDVLKGQFFFYFCVALLTNRTRIGYVEFRTIEMVDKALSLSGTVVMGLPIMVQLTEAERNRLHPGDGYVYLIGQHSCSY